MFVSVLVFIVVGGVDFNFYFRLLAPAGVLSRATHLLFPSGLVLLFSIVAIASILALEHRYPARPGQRLLSTGFWQDLTWVLCNVIIFVSLVRAFDELLYRSVGHYLALLRLSLEHIPTIPRVMLAVAVMDFFHWAAHIAHHKARLLWRLHTIHHSQPDLNAFSEHRIHPVEFVTENVMLYLPLILLDFGIVFNIGFATLRLWHGRLNHANVRTNLGVLRFVLVTPQSHRVHHSIERKHWDCNYGGLFSIWDHLFGTQYRNYDEYPATGVEDTSFPLERSPRAIDLVRTYGRQVAYPFRRSTTSDAVVRVQDSAA